MSNIIPFNNAVASIKDGESVNIEALRETRVFAKLMLAKGTKFSATKPKLKDFLLSESGEFIRAECFILGSKGQRITVDKLFINVAVKDTAMKPIQGGWVVELIHPSFDTAEFDSTESVTL